MKLKVLVLTTFFVLMLCAPLALAQHGPKRFYRGNGYRGRAYGYGYRIPPGQLRRMMRVPAYYPAPYYYREYVPYPAYVPYPQYYYPAPNYYVPGGTRIRFSIRF